MASLESKLCCVGWLHMLAFYHVQRIPVGNYCLISHLDSSLSPKNLVTLSNKITVQHTCLCLITLLSAIRGKEQDFDI